MKSSPEPIFTELYADWPEVYKDTVLDAATFERSLSRCDLANCHGMCCYDGVYVENLVRDVLEILIAQRREDLRELGATIDAEIFVESAWRGQALGTKTAVRDYPFRSEMPTFPPHFNETICVFNDGCGRCTLQLLAVQDGRHPWDYKPPTCWLHPIDLNPVDVSLPNSSNDPNVYPDYPGYVSQTVCGGEHACGRPAMEVFTEELHYLEYLIRRPLRPAA